jgi:hypothetical protein
MMLVGVLVFTTGACGIISTPTGKPDIPGLPATLAVQTIAANSELAGLICSSTPVPEDSAPEFFDTPTPSSLSAPMHTLAPTNTRLPKLTSVYASSFSDGEVQCFNAAEFVKDVTFPDNTFVKPKQKFTKIWQLRNIGTCTWTSDYLLVHVWGDQMKGDSHIPIGQTADPGTVIEVAVSLVAPAIPGSYQGDWMLQDPDGNRFGTGYKASEHFWVAVNIGSPKIPGFPSVCIGGR